MQQPQRWDVKVAIGIPCDPPNPRVKFDGEVAWFADGAYWFVANQLAHFGVRNVPTWFFDCWGGCELMGVGLEELGWFAEFLLRVLAEYPDRWAVDALVFGQPAFVERALLEQELSRLTRVLHRASESGRPVESFGD